MKAEKLSKLRQNIDQIDARIIELIAERQVNVEHIGNVKNRTNTATRDYRREKQVLDKVRQLAQQQNLDEQAIQEIFSLIIETSLSKQESQKINRSAYGSNKSALIIGGNGKMGRWLAHFLHSQDFQVDINDINANGGNSVAELTAENLDHDYIIIATPIEISAAIIEQLMELKPKGIVLDISSIKSPLRRPLQQLADSGCKVVSIHPMFGPDTQLLAGKHVIFINLGSQTAVNKVKALFEPTMAKQIDMEFADHDRLISYVLGLSHIVNIAFMTVLSESGEAAKQLAKLSSTTFDAQLEVAGKVMEENPELYYEIQKLNHHSPEMLNALADTVQRLVQVVERGNREAFVQIMQKARSYSQTR